MTPLRAVAPRRAFHYAFFKSKLASTTRHSSALCSAGTPKRPSNSTSRGPATSYRLPPTCRRFFSSEKSAADSLIEDIQDQYATARDEFEMASEETEKKTVYAADDRAAAREELDKLKKMFETAVGGTEGEEVARRVGQRIRELDNAVIALEESALRE